MAAVEAIDEGLKERQRMLRLAAIGHSHLAALMKGFKDLRTTAPDMPVRVHFISLQKDEYRPPLKNGKLVPPVVEAIENVRPHAILSAVAGNTHTVLGLVRHPVPFDFVLPQEPDLPLDESADVVPSGVVTAWLKEALEQNAFRILAALREVTDTPIFHLESPPPIANAEFISQVPESKFSDRIAELGVAPVMLRYKLWRLHSLLLEECCAGLDITYVPVPKEMQDKDGMLIEAAWENATHGNAVFGRALLDAAIARVQCELGPS